MIKYPEGYKNKTINFKIFLQNRIDHVGTSHRTRRRTSRFQHTKPKLGNLKIYVK